MRFEGRMGRSSGWLPLLGERRLGDAEGEWGFGAGGWAGGRGGVQSSPAASTTAAY